LLRIAPTTKYFRSIIKFGITVRNADPCDGNKYFSIIELRLEKHPDKTFIRRIEKGVDFLGYHFSPEGLSVAEKTIEKFLARAVRLYEQDQGESFGSPRLGLYARRWVRWIRGIASKNTPYV
jgi:hypothetical protein